MASRKELLESIRPDMKLTKNFFLQIYGYSITTPEFAEKALSRMEILGSTRARNHYACIVAECEHYYEQQMKGAATQYVADLEAKWKQKEGEERRRQYIIQNLHQKSDRELLSLLQTLS